MAIYGDDDDENRTLMHITTMAAYHLCCTLYGGLKNTIQTENLIQTLLRHLKHSRGVFMKCVRYLENVENYIHEYISSTCL